MEYKDIKPYIEKGLVSEQFHPQNSDIRIFNYTNECQFSRTWDDITEQCRGLIMNIKTGEVLARPFRKFFNYEEHINLGKQIPLEEPIITDKLDGSLGILYVLENKPYIATRGSFTSEQAIWATEWWRKHVNQIPQDNQTHLFEIIYPENRIVVNYDFSGLVYLGTIDTNTGYNIENQKWPDVVRVAEVQKFENTEISDLTKLATPNAEGFVILFPKSNLRLKVKFEEYVRLHKLITGLSEIAVWEHLKDGGSMQDLVKNVPDEFFKWVSDVCTKLKNKYHDIWVEADTVTAEAMLLSPERKERAMYITKNTKYSGICFAMLDNKDYESLIWKMIRPRGQKVFKLDEI